MNECVHRKQAKIAKEQEIRLKVKEEAWKKHLVAMYIQRQKDMQHSYWLRGYYNMTSSIKLNFIKDEG